MKALLSEYVISTLQANMTFASLSFLDLVCPGVRPHVSPPEVVRVHRLLDEPVHESADEVMSRTDKAKVIYALIAAGRDTVKSILAGLAFNMPASEIRAICTYLVEAGCVHVERVQRGRADYQRYTAIHPLPE